MSCTVFVHKIRHGMFIQPSLTFITSLAGPTSPNKFICRPKKVRTLIIFVVRLLQYKSYWWNNVLQMSFWWYWVVCHVVIKFQENGQWFQNVKVYKLIILSLRPTYVCKQNVHELRLELSTCSRCRVLYIKSLRDRRQRSTSPVLLQYNN